MKFEERFDSHYHFGAVEGLNCLEGKDINVVGLPNLDDSIYKLYAMLAGDDISNADMKPMRIKYNGYNFKIQTFDDYFTRKIQLWNLYKFQVYVVAVGSVVIIYQSSGNNILYI
jgi:hypothetical protein